MDHDAGTRAPRPASHPVLAGASGLWLGAASAATLGAWLGSRLDVLVHATGALQVDDMVELAALAAGVAVLGWLAVSCAVAALCLTARAAGGGWRRGEAWVHRWAPVVVQRAVVLAVASGLGLSAATGASASAGLAAPSPTPSVSVMADGSAAADLGWVPTPQTSSASPSTPSASSAGAPAQAGDALDPTSAPTLTPPSSTPSTTDAGARTSTAVPVGVPTSAARSAVLDSAGAGGATDSARADSATADSATARSGTAGPASGGDVASPATGAGSAASGTTTGTVTVEPGDTLWAIAARHLPAGADDAQIAAAWPAWYAANRGTIGERPDLIHPGQLLAPPTHAVESAS